MNITVYQRYMSRTLCSGFGGSNQTLEPAVLGSHLKPILSMTLGTVDKTESHGKIIKPHTLRKTLHFIPALPFFSSSDVPSN